MGKAATDTKAGSGAKSIAIDLAQLPFLSELARYEVTEAGMRQFLIDRGVDLDLLTGGKAQGN